MKRFVLFLFGIFTCAIVLADTITINWDNGNQAYETTTCEAGDDIVLPQTTPTKRGYTFQGWKLLPYIPLEYIENVPSETYFDTGFYPNNNSKVIVDFLKPLTGSDACPVVSAGGLFRIYAFLSTNNPNIPSSYFNNSRTYTANVSTGVLHKYSLDKSTWSVVDINFKRDVKQENASFRSTSPVFIFAENANSVTSCVIRLYSLQFYQDDVLVHDYIPVKKSDGTVCLYDKVTGDFLYNLGTSDPVAGPSL